MQQAARLRGTIFQDVHAVEPRPFDFEFDSFVQQLRDCPAYASKDACPLLTLEAYGGVASEKGSYRHNDNVQALHGVIGDYDAEAVSIDDAAFLLDLAGVQAILYTTARHTDAAPRWRVLAPFAHDRAREDHTRYTARLNGVLDGKLGDESFALSQSYFFGRVEGVEYQVIVVHGTPIDLLDQLDGNAVGKSAGRDSAPEKDNFGRQMALRRVDAQTLADVCQALDHLPDVLFDEYNTWVPKIGQALYSLAQAGHEAEALEMWHKHSARSVKYDADQAQRKWESLRPNAISYLTIFEMAGEHGWRNPKSAAGRFESNAEELERRERERSKEIGEGELPAPTQRVLTGSEMLGELVFVADGARVAFVDEPRRVLPRAEMRALLAGSVDTQQMPDGRRSKIVLFDRWLEHAERKTVFTQTFAPGRTKFCNSPEGELAQNLWIDRPRSVPDNWRELAAPFFEHVAYLVPIAAERERFLDWLAHSIQQPGELPSGHYLMVTPQTGIGRNWLAYAMARVHAGHTALGFDLGGTLASGFNGHLSRKILAVVDELQEGSPLRDTRHAEQKLKSMLTETTRLINPKFGRQHIEFNCCRFLMLSNHDDALPLSENDRRVVVIRNPDERKPPEYYAHLYTLLDAPGFGNAIHEALRVRDISAFNPGSIAPMNDAKRAVVEAGRTELEKAVRAIAEQWPSACVTSSRLADELRKALGEPVRSLSAAAKAGLYSLGQVRIGGDRPRVWALRDAGVWKNAAPAAIADEVKRGERDADEYMPVRAGEVFEAA